MTGSGDSSAALKEQQAQRQSNIELGMQNINHAFAGYNPAFYAGVRQNALNTLQPQLEDQYRQNRRSLAFNMGGRGILQGSATRMANTDLQKSHALGQITVANQANDIMRQTQQQVEGQKQGVTNQLITSQDPSMAAQQAVSAASSITAPSLVAPLGNLFQSFGNAYLANQVGQTYPGGASLGNMFRSDTSAQGKNYYTR